MRQSPSHPSAAAQVDGCAAFTLDVFAEVMKNINAAGNDALLNPHFRSQKTGGCFGGQGNGPQAWSRVIEISNATAISELAQHLGTTLAFPHAHESFSHEIEVSDQARQDLEAATAEEAAFLAPYLGQSVARGDLRASTGTGPWRRTADGSRWLFTLPPEQDVD